MSVEEASAFRFKLSDEQRRIVATVRDLTQSEFKPRGLQYMNGAFPWENIRGLARLGILGMAVPENYGGFAFGVFETALVLDDKCVDYVEDACRLKILGSDFYGTGKIPSLGFFVHEQHWRLK